MHIPQDGAAQTLLKIYRRLPVQKLERFVGGHLLCEHLSLLSLRRGGADVEWYIHDVSNCSHNILDTREVTGADINCPILAERGRIHLDELDISLDGVINKQIISLN